MLDRIITIEGHIYERQREFPAASGEFSALLTDIALAGKIISREVNKAGLVDILGRAGTVNVQEEDVLKLDVLARDTMVNILKRGGHVCAIATEEDADIIPVHNERPRGHYVVLFDPLDGSSNIDANVSIGTIFAIHRCTDRGKSCGDDTDALQTGNRLACAGYIIYGSSTMLVYTTGVGGVHGFTLDPSLGEFLLSHPDIRIPERGGIYSINEGNELFWKEHTRRYIRHLKEKASG
jgi:fructose-1,6-bisphosphatase I